MDVQTSCGEQNARVGNTTCQAADEPLLSVLVEQVRAEYQLQALVARLPGARRQHLIQQRHLLIANTTDTRQGVFDQTQDLPERWRGTDVNKDHTRPRTQPWDPPSIAQ